MESTEEALEDFRKYLIECEKGISTQKNYVRTIRDMIQQPDYVLSKEWMAVYRNRLKERYSGTTVNNRLAAINNYLEYKGEAWKVKYIRIQKKAYIEESREFGRKEYENLLKACEEDKRLYLAVETLCSTGIRIGELKHIRAELLDTGSVNVLLKGKQRRILLPDRLIERLKQYCKEQNIEEGPVFVTRTGRPLDRSNLWRSMKRAGEKAGLSSEKVYPHNLRHLFASVFYRREKDLLKLADILGHSSIETTRQYLVSSGKEHRQKINEMDLVK